MISIRYHDPAMTNGLPDLPGLLDLRISAEDWYLIGAGEFQAPGEPVDVVMHYVYADKTDEVVTGVIPGRVYFPDL